MGYKATIMRTADGRAVDRNVVVTRDGKHYIGIPVEDDNGRAQLVPSDIEVNEADVIVHKTIRLGDKVLATEWNFDLSFAECEEAERLFGQPFSKFEALVDQSIVAKKILVHVLLKRENPTARLSDLDGVSRSDYHIDVRYEDAPPPDEVDPTQAAGGSNGSEPVSPALGPSSENEPAQPEGLTSDGSETGA